MPSSDLSSLIQAAQSRALEGVWDVDAEELNRRIITLDPNNPGAHTRLARIVTGRGEVAEARALYEHVLELDPTNRIALNRVGGSVKDSASASGGTLAALGDELRRVLDATELIDVTESQVPSFSWPDETETFDLGWLVSLRVAGRPHRAWHGLNRKTIHAAVRRHSVTWLEGCPAVEAEATDDHRKSRRLVSLIKHPGGRHVTSRTDLPHVYEKFDIVVHAEEVQAPYAYESLCVRAAEDDVARWVDHALLRAVAWGALEAEG